MFSINHRYSGTEIANIVNPNTINKKKVGGKYATSLGVYENNNITWIKRFEYPNS